MSYRRSWLLVDSMNRCWAGKLVAATAGGGPESGAHLTAFGRRVLAGYRRLEAQLAKAADDENLAELCGLLRQAPAPTSS